MRTLPKRSAASLALIFLSSLGLGIACAFAVAAPPDGASASDAAPSWIWLNKEAGADDAAHFRKAFTIVGDVKSAKLYASCDNQMRVFLDGRPVGDSRSWESPFVQDLTSQLKQGGRHVLAVQGKNEGGPAGLVAKLVVETANQGSYAVISDASWKVSATAEARWQRPGFSDASWANAQVLAPLGGGPWAAVNAKTLLSAAPRKAPEATDPKTLNVVKGFQVELLYTVPEDTQGSWVNMTVDPKGRLIVSDQYGQLYRVTPPPPGGKIQASDIEQIDVPIGEAQGLLWAFDSLYVVVNGARQYQSGLYRVKDTNGDDKLDKVEQLRALQGGGEHGPHAVLLAPDGKSLTIVCGNGTKFVGTDLSKVPLLWSEDHILPRMPDGNGFMRDVLAPGGCIYNVDPDGKRWELLSMGYRNEFDAGYHREGELFTYDADMEWDMNTPWYRPTRVCLASSGTEFGWRNGAGKWPAYYPDSAPPTVNIGPGSPTGVVFGYGAKFPAKYQDAFYICDWSYGKLYAVHLQPDGSTWKGEAEEFITGAPLPLTDLVIRPQDGAMYFAIGGRRTKSGLYRVTYNGPESTSPSQPDPNGPGSDLRALRRKLESFHGHEDPNAVATAWPHLGHADRAIRYAARVAIEHQNVETWQDRALAERDPVATINAMIALARAGQKRASLQPKALESLDRIDWAKLTDSQKIDLLRAYGLVLMRMGRPGSETIARLVKRFDPHYPTPNNHDVNAELAKMLISLEAPTAASKTVALLTKAATQEQKIELATSLRVLKAGWTPELRKTYFSWFLEAASYRGGNSIRGFMRNIKNDAVASLSEAEKTELASIINATPVAPAPPQPANANRPIVKKWTTDELAPLVEAGLSNRDFERGRKVFSEASCFSCHRYANEGGAFGPDLTGVSGRFSPRDLLESIVVPSKTISDQYAATVFELDDGRVIIGRVVNLNNENMMVNTNMLDPNLMESVDRRRVERSKPSPLSMMPEGLLNTFKEDEVLDLMAYLLSRGDPNSPIFKKAAQP